MQSPLCDLMTGNVPGARRPHDPAVAAAVETRGQRQKAMRPLSTPCEKQGVKATPLEVKGAQQYHSSLRGLLEAAKEGGGGQNKVWDSRGSGEQGTVVPGFYKLQDRTGEVAVGRAVQIP